MDDFLPADIEYSILVRAAPERVYDAIATADGLDAWFTSGTELDARPGGSICFRWKKWGPQRVTSEDGGPVLAAERPHRFVFQWRPDNITYFTTVTITLRAVDEGTVVDLRESGYHNSVEGLRAMLNCAAGWGEALALMKFYVEHGVRY